MSLLLPLTSCLDADPEDALDDDLDEATSALSAAVTDAVLEISGKVAGRVLDVTADPDTATLKARLDVAHASALFERFASDAASGTSTALDLAFTGYASQVVTTVAATSATMNGVTLEAARQKDGTIGLVVTLTFSAASVAVGPGAWPAISPTVSNVSVGWEVTGLASAQIARVKTGATRSNKAKGWQKSYFVPIGVPGGIPPQSLSATMQLTVDNLSSGVTRVVTIQGVYGDLGWTNDSPPAWTMDATGDSKGMVVA
ncbi:MAG: hypothetical protein IPM79_17310 [Polyangiaceae bacterium]|jgi:hypothetical protein|nr:hypothetical protein [Polyangiaceae bacterium]MBK8939326.1 hypothetical protein [Polyangiaceae bacterium]